MKRRDFFQASILAAGGTAAVRSAGKCLAAGQPRFKLKYAPHFGMFRASAGKDPIDQLKFAADQGFAAWEDNGMKGRDVSLQE